ncbi:PH domain-containing protein [Luteimonas sp. BDR2-5]|uniref:PH domain-containing protein n=1 Tax=Proluteimonas luteida TaxID=2878685 RepID=UPI001E5CC413|nr:PH domain-containing protein [Luteimonas sp. BDR2-5]MCD9027251.1 PH domain-containing protein [Luteimonas sp. BDR2-5]
MSARGAGLPDVEVLRPAPWKMLALLAISAGFVWLAVDIGGRHPLAAWLCGGFFALCALVALVALVPGANHLRLDADGLEIRSLFRTTRLAWGDIARFGPTRVGLHTMVGLDFADHVDRAARLRRVNRGLTGYHGALPDTYGHKAGALATRLEAWRQAHAGPAD